MTDELNMKKNGKRKHEEVADLRTRTKALALQVIRLYSGLPKQTEAQVIGRQMIRSGTSVGANYREAYRARSKAEFIAKAGECLKEIEETSYWLELLVGEWNRLRPKCLFTQRNINPSKTLVCPKVCRGFRISSLKPAQGTAGLAGRIDSKCYCPRTVFISSFYFLISVIPVSL